MLKEINAIAIDASKEEYEFTFEISDNATNKDILDKAFEIAYCKLTDLEEVKILD